MNEIVAKPFQVDGIKFLARTPQAILADDMGLGKTFQVIETIRRIQDPAPNTVLVVCPKIAVAVWRRELRRIGVEPFLITSRNHAEVFYKGDSTSAWNIVTINILRLNQTLFKTKLDILVVDEAHQIKDIHSVGNKALTPIAMKTPRVWLLTGTPIKNNYSELFSLARLVVPHRRLVQYDVSTFGNWKKKFCVLEYEDVWTRRMTPMGMKAVQIRVEKIAGNINGKLMREVIGPYFLRRKKREVQTELKGLRWQSHPVDLKFKSGLTETEIAEAVAAAEKGVAPVKTHIMRKRAELAMALAPYAVEIAADYVDMTGRPIVVFCYHLDPLHLAKFELEKRGLRVAMITGDTSADDRGRIQDKFQAGELDVILGQTISAGQAITLTRSSYCLFIDLCWSPADNAQAHDRLDRIGQTEEVIAQYLVADDPLSSRVTEILAAKTAAIQEFDA